MISKGTDWSHYETLLSWGHKQVSCSYISFIHLCFGFCALHPPRKPPTYFSPPRTARLLCLPASLRPGWFGQRQSLPPPPGSAFAGLQHPNAAVERAGTWVGAPGTQREPGSAWRRAVGTRHEPFPFPSLRAVLVLGRRRQLLSPSLPPANGF